MKDLLSDQVATRSRQPQFFGDLGAPLPNPDPVLKKLGKAIAVYRDLRSDAQIGGNVRRRKSAVKAMERGFALEAGAKNTVLATITAIFADLPLDRMISEILDAALFGYQPLEVIWGKVGKLIVPVDVLGKPPEWFLFDADNRLRLKTKEAAEKGELLPDKKFLVPRQEASYDNPYGIPDLAMCFWPTTFKRGGLKFWMQFTEKYGSPWVVGKHPRNTPAEETEDLLDKLDAMVQSAVAVVPDDASIQIIEAAGKSNSADVYERLLMFCRSEVNYALLGQNQTSEASSTRASAQAGLEVTGDIRDADAALVSETINTLIRWIAELNFAGGDRPIFSMWAQESVDKVMAERDKTLTEAGLVLTPSYFQRAYGFLESDIVAAVAEAPPSAQVAFAEGGVFPDQAAVDEAIAELADNALSEEAETMLQPLLEVLEKAVDENEALAILEKAYPTLNSEALEAHLAPLLFAAQLVGQASVAKEIANG